MNIEVFNPRLFNKNEMVAVGRFGKSVGLNGTMKVHLLSDFKDILTSDINFYLALDNDLESIILNNPYYPNEFKIKLQNKEFKNFSSIKYNNFLEQLLYLPISIKSFNNSKHTIILNEFSSKNDSQKLVNLEFFSTIEDTRKYCKLEKDEFFYFDIIGLNVVENDEILGVVKEIQEIGNTHYFILEKNFLIPYIDRYILEIDVANKKILTCDAKYLKM